MAEPSYSHFSHVDRNAIASVHWSMQVDRERARSTRRFGQIASEIADLEQGIWNLVLTPKGSVPGLPQKGVDLAVFMDRPPAVAIPALQVDIWEGLRDWHPRIVVDEVRIEPVGAAEQALTHFRCPVFWRPAARVLDELLRTDIEISRDASGAPVAVTAEQQVAA